MTINDSEIIPVKSYDMNGDYAVGSVDFAMFASYFNTSPGYPADFNWDGTVGSVDFAKFAAHFNH